VKNIREYIEIFKFGSEKDYKALEEGDGYIFPAVSNPVAVIHTKEDAKFIAVLTFQKDQPRGNHYHFDKIEYMTVLSGKLHVSCYLLDAKDEVFEFILNEREQVKILPGCVHTMTAIDGDVYALEYSPNRYRMDDVVFL
jgi:dTDP-4-dehydrorhamnose 3,5-epimerase-like enzyme